MDDAVLFHDVPRIENARLSEAVFELCAEFVQRYMALILKSAVPRRRHLAEAKCTEEACLRRGHSPKVNPKGAQACARRGGSMDFLMESGFMHWMSERMSFTNWVKADLHETSRIALKFSATPREISARRGEFALRQLLFLG